MEKIYTQDDMDNIVSKVKESQKAKFEKTHISLEAFKELENKYSLLLEQNKINSFKDKFVANGGNPQAYNDFINNHKNIIDMNEKDLDNEFKTLKESKPYFFNNVASEQSKATNVPKDNEVMQDMFGSNDDLISGTIYKKTW